MIGKDTPHRNTASCSQRQEVRTADSETCVSDKRTKVHIDV